MINEFQNIYAVFK